MNSVKFQNEYKDGTASRTNGRDGDYECRQTLAALGQHFNFNASENPMR